VLPVGIVHPANIEQKIAVELRAFTESSKHLDDAASVDGDLHESVRSDFDFELVGLR